MNVVFKKLNYKEQETLYVLHCPDSFETQLKEMAAHAIIKKKLSSGDKAGFIIAFCTKQIEINKLTPTLLKALLGDGLLWFAYPKGTSKKYTCDFNRDTGWKILGSYGFEPVRMVAIDEDWSALRFRRVEYIKKMNRSTAITKLGNEKIVHKN
jgi:hypothetical protein